MEEYCPVRHMVPPGYQAAIEHVQQARDLGKLVGANLRRRLQCQKALRSRGKFGTAVVSSRHRVLLPLFKAFVRPHLECLVQTERPCLERDTKMLEHVRPYFTR